MHFESWEPTGCGSGPQNFTAIGVDFDGPDGGMAEDAVCQESAAGSGKEVKRSHVIAPPMATGQKAEPDAPPVPSLN